MPYSASFPKFPGGPDAWPHKEDSADDWEDVVSVPGPTTPPGSPHSSNCRCSSCGEESEEERSPKRRRIGGGCKPEEVIDLTGDTDDDDTQESKDDHQDPGAMFPKPEPFKSKSNVSHRDSGNSGGSKGGSGRKTKTDQRRENLRLLYKFWNSQFFKAALFNAYSKQFLQGRRRLSHRSAIRSAALEAFDAVPTNAEMVVLQKSAKRRVSSLRGTMAKKVEAHYGGKLKPAASCHNAAHGAGGAEDDISPKELLDTLIVANLYKDIMQDDHE